MACGLQCASAKTKARAERSPVSRVASESSAVQSHQHTQHARRPAAGSAQQAPSPFSALIDQASATPDQTGSAQPTTAPVGDGQPAADRAVSAQESSSQTAVPVASTSTATDTAAVARALSVAVNDVVGERNPGQIDGSARVGLPGKASDGDGKAKHTTGSQTITDAASTSNTTVQAPPLVPVAVATPTAGTASDVASTAPSASGDTTAETVAALGLQAQGAGEAGRDVAKAALAGKNAPAGKPQTSDPRATAASTDALSDATGDAAPPAPTGLQAATPAAPTETAATGKQAPARASRATGADATPTSDALAGRPDAASSTATTGRTDTPDATQMALQPTAGAAGSTAPTTAAAAANIPTMASLPASVPVAGLAVAIAAQSQAGNSRFEIRLDPPELGRIDVHLDVDRNGHVTSRLVVEKSETLDLLRRDAPQLERALQQAGLKTGDSGLQFTLRDQSFNGQNQNPSGQSLGTASRLVIPDSAVTPLEASSSAYGWARKPGGGIDIRV